MRLGHPEVWWSVSRIESEDIECQALDWVWEHGCGTVATEMEESVWVLVLETCCVTISGMSQQHQTNWRGNGVRFQRQLQKLDTQCLTFSDLFFEANSLMSCFSTQPCFLCQLRNEDTTHHKIKLYYHLWEFLPSCILCPFCMFWW